MSNEGIVKRNKKKNIEIYVQNYVNEILVNFS